MAFSSHLVCFISSLNNDISGFGALSSFLLFGVISALWRGSRFFFLVVLVIVLRLNGLDLLPFNFSLDSVLERSVGVSLSVVADKSVPPELVGEESTGDGVGVVDLVVVADPAADESPHSFPGRVSSEHTDLGGFAAYNE